jgi:hypothetical protein
MLSSVFIPVFKNKKRIIYRMCGGILYEVSKIKKWERFLAPCENANDFPNNNNNKQTL